MTIVLSSGYGRLHLAQSAEYLSKAGVDVKLVCGWTPVKTESWLVKLCSRIVGRDLSGGLRKRRIKLTPSCGIYPFAFLEFLTTAVLMAEGRIAGGRFRKPLVAFMWQLFGWQTRGVLRKEIGSSGATVFHVRAGAGQGGAIKVAKKLGMRVVVDHSALHPEQSEINLTTEYERWGQQVAISPKRGVWKNVMADCSEADILLVNANHIRDSFVERGYDASKIRVVYLGVRQDFRDVHLEWLAKFGANDVPKVLFTGNFSLLKGAEYVLESLRLLIERGVKVHYDIVGAISVPRILLDKYAELQTSHNTPITFHGPVHQDDLKKFLAECDIYLFPSLADGCANSGMEALTAGMPVVTTYQSGLPITDGETGCVVPMKDAKAVADKIEWLLSHPAECERLGSSAARMMKENYTWEKYAEKVKLIYEERGEK